MDGPLCEVCGHVLPSSGACLICNPNNNSLHWVPSDEGIGMEKSGWVIRSEYGMRHHKTGEYITSFSWWYGPDHGWGNTWGNTDRAATWPTKKAAEKAALESFGMGWRFEPRRDRRRQAQKYSEALIQSEARSASYLLTWPPTE